MFGSDQSNLHDNLITTLDALGTHIWSAHCQGRRRKKLSYAAYWLSLCRIAACTSAAIKYLVPE